MKKPITIILLVIAAFFLMIISMFAFKLCPPQGPWPSPPWCVKEVPFEYKELPYITESFQPTSKQLDFGIGTYDVWGNMHLFLDLGEDTRNLYRQTIKRLGTINAELYLITDSVTLGKGGTLISTTENGGAGIGTISEDYLNEIGSLTKQNGISKFMVFTNINDNVDEVEGYLQVVEDTKTEKIIAEQYKQATEKSGGYTSQDIFNDYNKEDWDLMFERWTQVMTDSAKKAEKAGAKYMIINPGDAGFNYRLEFDYQKVKYEEVAKEVRKYFNGKIGIIGQLKEIKMMNWDFIDFNVVTFNAHSDPIIQDIFKNVNDDVDEIEKAFNIYFNRPEWNNVNKETYLLTIITSVDNGVKTGWIPITEIFDKTPNQKAQALAYEGMFRALYTQDTKIDGIISYGYWWNDRLYPETKVLRNDVDYTIRNKDAEQVFYKWSNIFS
ncbi:MAG: hypothetical protein ABIJ08_01385 [Nanoarchaeota archaeon]